MRLRALLGLAALVGCQPKTESAEQRSAASTSVCGQIVFATSEGEHHTRISQLSAAGGPRVEPGAIEVGSSEVSRFPAAVSPDGRSLLVLRSQTLDNGKTRDRFELHELSATGELLGSPRAIGPEGAMLRNPSFSPDGVYLVFESDAESFRDLYRLELGNQAVLRLTNDPEGNFEPAVSPDAASIAFVSSRDGNAELYLMSSDGGDPRRLTDSRGDDTSPVWSPDGQRLAFVSSRDRGRGYDVYVLEPSGDRVEPLVRDGSRNESVFAQDLVFAPDGTRLAFTERVPTRGEAAIVVVGVADGRVVFRTHGEGSLDEQAAWSPDGRHLAFARSSGELSDIVRIGRDGDGLERLTAGDGVHWLPRWLGSC